MKRRIAYELFNPNLSLAENAENLGCSVAALKKHLSTNEIDWGYDSQYAKWKAITDFKKKNSKASLRSIASELGYSVNTIRRYLSLSEDDLNVSKRNTNKVSHFDIRNSNCIKSVSSNQEQILLWIMHLYNEDKPFDADLTASLLKFYKHNVPTPQYLYDKYPQLPNVKDLNETDSLPDSSFNSIVFDLPFIVDRVNTDSIIKNRFTYFHDEKELIQANLQMLNRSFRLLKSGGLLVVKTMDCCYAGKQIWVSDFVIQEASKMGFHLLDKFILLSNWRLISKTKQQHSARKFHSYFFVFKK